MDSKELGLLTKIDRFGIEAILGRKTFYYGELKSMIIAENIFISYQSRQKSTNWVEWSTSNPNMAKLLNEAETLCQTLE